MQTYQRNKQALIQEILNHHKRLNERKKQELPSSGSEVISEESSDCDGRESIQRKIREEVERVEQQQR